VGEGSTFTFLIPIEQPEEKTEKIAAVAAGSAGE